MQLKSIIIDDSDQAREYLKGQLNAVFPNLFLIEEASGVVEGAKLIRNSKPNLVFLDIQLNDGTGFDLLEVIGQVDFSVIFTTASDAHAIKAFRYSAVDYLLKPINEINFKTAVERAIKNKPVKASLDVLIDRGKKHNKLQDKLALHTQEKIAVVDIKNIVRCEADVNYTCFYFNDKTKMMVTRTLKDFEEILEEKGFLRVHQSHLVNVSYIKEFNKRDGGYLLLSEGSNVPVSMRKRTQVMDLLSND